MGSKPHIPHSNPSLMLPREKATMEIADLFFPYKPHSQPVTEPTTAATGNLSLEEGKGFGLMVGPTGTGKTATITCACNKFPKGVLYTKVFEPNVFDRDLAKEISMKIGECIRVLEEKEAEKKRKAEEKQQNKLERERKRREREEIAAEKKKRREEKLTAIKPKQKCVKHKPNKKKATTEDDSVCPICSSAYSLDVEEGNGREWILCACGVWLHEDCIPEATVDIIQEEEELYCCPECIDYDDY